MASWDYWFKCGDEFTPIEFDEDGNLAHVIDGMCLITSLHEMKKRSKKIWEVDNIYDPTDSKVKVVWDAKQAGAEQP